MRFKKGALSEKKKPANSYLREEFFVVLFLLSLRYAVCLVFFPKSLCTAQANLKLFAPSLELQVCATTADDKYFSRHSVFPTNS